MTTIIGLHCSGSGRRQWARVAAALTPAHAMLAPDLIGYGEDAWSPGDGAVSLDAEAARSSPSAARSATTCARAASRLLRRGSSTTGRARAPGERWARAARGDVCADAQGRAGVRRALRRHGASRGVRTAEDADTVAREGEATRTPTRAIARALLPVLPDARYVRVGGAGHMGPITHAEIARFVVTVERGERLGLAA